MLVKFSLIIETMSIIENHAHVTFSRYCKSLLCIPPPDHKCREYHAAHDRRFCGNIIYYAYRLMHIPTQYHRWNNDRSDSVSGSLSFKRIYYVMCGWCTTWQYTCITVRSFCCIMMVLIFQAMLSTKLWYKDRVKCINSSRAMSNFERISFALPEDLQRRRWPL